MQHPSCNLLQRSQNPETSKCIHFEVRKIPFWTPPPGKIKMSNMSIFGELKRPPPKKRTFGHFNSLLGPFFSGGSNMPYFLDLKWTFGVGVPGSVAGRSDSEKPSEKRVVTRPLWCATLVCIQVLPCMLVVKHLVGRMNEQQGDVHRKDEDLEPRANNHQVRLR